MRRAALALTVVATLLAAARAVADERISAETRDRYANPAVTIDQGERLTFFNGDLLDDHSVTATANNANSRPLFDSGLIGPGREAATVRLAATTRLGRRTVALGSATVKLSGAGSRSASIRLSAAARRALRARRRVTVSLTGQATDRAGNASAATARRVLRS